MMVPLWQAVLGGLVFGFVAVLVMLPMDFGDRVKKSDILTAAFIERFMLGFLIPNAMFPLTEWQIGLLLGILLSLPSAIVTKAYLPIIGLGAVGGLFIGLIVH